MNFLNNLLGFDDVKKMLNYNFIMLIIIGIAQFLIITINNTANYFTAVEILSSFLIIAAYLKWIQTNGGKYFFFSFNALLTLILTIILIPACIDIFSLIEYESNTLYIILYITEIIYLLASLLYFIFVFILKNKYSIKILKGKINTIYYYAILTLSIIVFIYLQFNIVNNTYYYSTFEVFVDIIPEFFLLYAQYILLRIVYLYQKNKITNDIKVFKDIYEFNQQQMSLKEFFNLENISNNEIGKKFKTVAIFLKYLLEIGAFIGLIIAIVQSAYIMEYNHFYNSYSTIEFLLTYIGNVIGYIIRIVIYYFAAYISILFISGFGAIIEGTNKKEN